MSLGCDTVRVAVGVREVVRCRGDDRIQTKLMVPIALACALCGCANGAMSSRPEYFKTGSNEQNYQRALAGCRVQGAMVPQSQNSGNSLSDAGDSLFQTAIMMQTIKNCMIAQGWTPKS